MAKNAVNYTGLIPEVGDSFESSTINTTGSLEGIDTKIGIIENNITDINNDISNVDNTSDLTKVKVNTYADLNTTDKTIVGAINEVNSDLGDHIENIANPHAVTKTQVGLSNVDNTSDVTKMTASTFSGLNTTDKTIVGAINEVNSDLGDHIENIANPHAVTKTQVGLSNVDNTSDVTKMTASTFSGLNTTDKTIVGAINETIITDSAVNGNIKIAGVESTVYTHPNHSGDIISTGDGDTVISENAVSNSQLAQMPTMTIKGNNEITTGNAEDLTASEVQTMIQDTTHRFVTDSQISLWNSTAPAIKYYNTQANAITEASNVNVGDKIQTFGGSSVNDGLGGLYLIQSTLSGGGFTIATGKHANFLNSKGLGVGQTWQNVTPSRVINQTYTNTTGKPIMILVVGGINSSVASIMKINGLDVGKLTTGSSSGNGTFTTIIPSGNTYSVYFFGGLTTWFELR